MTSPEVTSPELPDPVSALFPRGSERREIENFLTVELERALARVANGPVSPTLDLAVLRDELEDYRFQDARPLAEVLRWTMERLEHGVVQLSNPRYFGLFNPGANFPSQCAERVTNAFNPQLASSASSPMPVEVERHVLRAFAERAGLGRGAGGHFTGGGSEANCTALVCALTVAHPDFATEGARAFAGSPVFYTSRDCHIAWLKIAHQCGVGRAALRLVATDGRGRMDPMALAREIERDRAAGRIPVLIVATAGTTSAGMIDPLDACADIARGAGLWYHVDAAWGGAALASERLRPLLAGIERADSVTLDAHKWLATTMGCGLFLTRHPSTLAAAFHASTSFMPSEDPNLDPYLSSLQWSRRFLGLRLFVALASAGWAGYGAHVERAVAVIGAVRDRLVSCGWTVVNASPLAVLNVVPPAGLGEVRALVQRVVSGGRAWVAAATFEGRDVVRICATHGETSLADVDALVTALNAPWAEG